MKNMTKVTPRKPILSPRADPKDYPSIGFPKYWSQKLDGIRCLILPNGKLVSRTFKDIPNRHFKVHFAELLNISSNFNVIFDGEIWAEELDFSEISSTVRSYSKRLDPAIKFHCFEAITLDEWNHTSRASTFNERRQLINLVAFASNARIIKQTLIFKMEEALRLTDIVLQKGGEGGMLRDPKGIYKHNRCTAREDNIWKLKKFEFEEATVIGFEPYKKMKGNIIREVDSFGSPKKTSRQENLETLEALGALWVMMKDKTRVKLGSGFNFRGGMKDRIYIWNNRNQFLGKKVRFKYQACGTKDKPRLPIFMGWL